ncbi:MAG TPA: SH3 domain-containing protein [Desulfobacterales bacterium]|nr:SH3 domain-containing protein [Desulfobacterales bacterium]
MKRYSLIIVGLLLLHGTALSSERFAVSVPTANIRSGPGEKYDILWKVERYYPILILQKSGHWYFFKDFEGDKGWIHDSCIGKISSVISLKDNCNVRSMPDVGAMILFTVEKGIPFKIIERKGEWIHIEHSDGDKGWIHQSLVW